MIPIERKSNTIYLAMCIAIIILATPHKGWTSEYLVASGDRLKITVVQWPEYSGDSQVDDSGHIMVQSAGRIRAEGHKVPEIEEMVRSIVAPLTDTQNLRVLVDIIEFRPISVLGEVNSPGRYPYAVNTTVLDAIAMAGGFIRLGRDNFRDGLQIARMREQISVLRLERIAALARRARLFAEQADLEAILFPVELLESQQELAVRSAMDQELRIFELRKRSNTEAAKLNPNQVNIYKNEVAALGRHAKAVDNTLKFMESELEKRAELLDRGLARTVQVVDMQSEVLDLKAERRRTILDSTRSKIKINELGHDAFLMENERQMKVAELLAEVETQLAILDKQIDSQKSSLGFQDLLLRETSSNSEELLPYRYSIMRSNGRENENIQALESTRVAPGDIIIVQAKN